MSLLPCITLVLDETSTRQGTISKIGDQTKGTDATKTLYAKSSRMSKNTPDAKKRKLTLLDYWVSKDPQPGSSRSGQGSVVSTRKCIQIIL
jgi:hypothetical protein